MPPAPPPDDIAAHVAARLSAGLADLRVGRFDVARTAFEAALALAPNHPDALHLLGMAQFSAGNPADALVLLGRAIAARPGFVAAIGNLGQILIRLGRREEGIARLRHAAEIAPAEPGTFRNLGIALLDAGFGEEALSWLRRAAARFPDDAAAHARLGLALLAQDQAAAAEASLRRALELAPAQPDLHLNLGAVLRRLDRPEEALASFRVALALRPGYPEASHNLGVALLERGETAEAVEHLRAAAAARPDFAEAQLALIRVLYALGRADEARAAGAAALVALPNHKGLAELVAALAAPASSATPEDAVALARARAAAQPDDAGLRVALAAALMRTGQLDEAMEACQAALGMAPEMAEAQTNAGAILLVQNRVAEARARYQAALSSAPDLPIARAALGVIALMQGDFLTGWAEYEWRWRLIPPPAPRLPALAPAPQPWWPSDPLHGRRVLLYAEQGLGDTLQFLRYARLVAAQGAEVVLEVQPPLMPLLANLTASLPGVVQVCARGEELPPTDLACPLLSLPRIYGTRLETIPADIPYLHPPAAHMARWRRRFADPPAATDRRRCVGLAISGNAGYAADRFRSIPLARFRSLLATPGVRFHLLHTELRPADAALLPEFPDLVDLRFEIADLADTAAIITEMDLVIAVDSVVAHLAGALGQRCWLLLPLGADWRWLQDRDDTPWYPRTRLFRQRTLGDWDEVLGRVAAALAAL